MDWFLLAFAAPVLWALSNHIDKFLIDKYFHGKSRALILFSCFIGLLVLPFIFLWQPSVLAVSPGFALVMILTGFLYISYLFPYFRALKKDDASTVTPIFQTIPVLTGIVAFFVLGETLTTNQLFASALVILGAIGISLHLGGKKVRLKWDILGLIMVSSMIIAVYSVAFKVLAVDADFWTAFFWQEIGFVLFGLILTVFVKGYREEMLGAFRQHRARTIGVNLFNEFINIVAVMVFNYATLLAPIALVYVINGFNPLLTLLFGLILTLFFPKIEREDIRGKVLLQKLFFIALIFAGAFMLRP